MDENVCPGSSEGGQGLRFPPAPAHSVLWAKRRLSPPQYSCPECDRRVVVQLGRKEVQGQSKGGGSRVLAGV